MDITGKRGRPNNHARPPNQHPTRNDQYRHCPSVDRGLSRVPSNAHCGRSVSLPRHCLLSRPTVRRYRETGKLPNAVKDAERGWIHPVGDLLAAGLRPGRSAPLSEPAQSENGPAHDLAQRVQQLETIRRMTSPEVV